MLPYVLKNKKWEEGLTWGGNYGKCAMSNLKVREGKVCPFDRRFRYLELCFQSGTPVRKPGSTFIAPAAKAKRIVDAINTILETDDSKALGPVELGMVREEPAPEKKPDPPWRQRDYYGKKVG